MDEWPCPFDSAPREYHRSYDGEVVGLLRCVACGREFADIGQPYEPTEIVAQVREHADTYASMNEAEYADATKRHRWWKEDG